MAIALTPATPPRRPLRPGKTPHCAGRPTGGAKKRPQPGRAEAVIHRMPLGWGRWASGYGTKLCQSHSFQGPRARIWISSETRREGVGGGGVRLTITLIHWLCSMNCSDRTTTRGLPLICPLSLAWKRLFLKALMVAACDHQLAPNGRTIESSSMRKAARLAQQVRDNCRRKGRLRERANQTSRPT